MQLLCGIFSVVLIVKTSMGYIGLRKHSILYDVVYHDLILEQLQCDDKSNRSVKKQTVDTVSVEPNVSRTKSESAEESNRAE